MANEVKKERDAVNTYIRTHSNDHGSWAPNIPPNAIEPMTQYDTTKKMYAHKYKAKYLRCTAQNSSFSFCMIYRLCVII